MKTSDYGWKMNYCGIFCNPQKGSETTGKIRCYLPAPGGISHIRDVSVFRSGYYDFVHRLGRPEKDAGLAEEIRQQQNKSHGTYGYQRMQLALAAKGIQRNPKTVLKSVAAEGGSIWDSRLSLREFAQ